MLSIKKKCIVAPVDFFLGGCSHSELIVSSMNGNVGMFIDAARKRWYRLILGGDNDVPVVNFGCLQVTKDWELDFPFLESFFNNPRGVYTYEYDTFPTQLFGHDVLSVRPGRRGMLARSANFAPGAVTCETIECIPVVHANPSISMLWNHACAKISKLASERRERRRSVMELALEIDSDDEENEEKRP